MDQRLTKCCNGFHREVADVPRLRRFGNNPILVPRADHDWESHYVFNAAAIRLDGQVHLVYRAIGDDRMSRLGYAVSRDGMHVDDRCDVPVYQFGPDAVPPRRASEAWPPLASGGSWHGCEDPRLTQVGDRIYLTYTDFGGWESPPAVAITSIAVDDFLARRWHWQPARLISPPGEVHKNWVVFPALFNGRYAVLHSLKPCVQVDYVDSLDDVSPNDIRSRHFDCARPPGWDNWIRGVGAPPIETPAGWLVIYHAMDRNDPGRYKLGVMLLDRDDPARILGRLPYPLLEPNARYENEGFKVGVVYNCGAVLSGDELLVYYGGADTVVCGASISLSRLLGKLQVA